MRSLEEKARKRRRRRNIQNIVLGTVGAVGILAVALIVPNVFQALPRIIGKERYKLAFQARTAKQRLVIKGHLRRRSKGFLEITDAGRRALAIASAREQSPARTRRRWDKQYRMVFFDIPQRRKSVRDRLRRLMKDFGFLRVQDSVWVSPYDCEDLIALVKAELRIEKDVLYAVVSELENDLWVKQHFQLSR